MNKVLNPLFCILFLVANITNAQSQVLTPTDYFGFKPGSDRMLFDYTSLISYLNKIDEVSDKLSMVEIGNSPLGKPMYIALVSTAANLENLDELRSINRELALDYNLSEQQRDLKIEKGKVFVLATLSMHSGEVAPTQASPLIIYDLITSTDEQTLEWLDNTVLMIVPSHNPDGMDMVVNHYNKCKGTINEGTSLPGVYHKYVGHDNNRDFVTLTQSDTKAIANVYNNEWYPQILVEKHQMGWYSARYFVPPMHDPISENIDATLWNWTTIIGSNLITDLTREGCDGVSQHYLFDDYWPGSTETALWKNIISLLTEAASVKYATPIYIEPNELRGFGKGLAEYKKSINMPQPWKGGWWRLSDIVRYEIVSTKSILKTASMNRKAILTFRNDICKSEVKKGQTEAPYYFILHHEQHDSSELLALVDLLLEHGVRIFLLQNSTTVDKHTLNKGDFVVPLAQPYRAFIKEVMEKQRFPERHYTPGGELIKPYDITSWSLPLHRGVSSLQLDVRSSELEDQITEIDAPGKDSEKLSQEYNVLLFDVNNNESFKAVFKALQKGNIERLLEDVEIKGKIYKKGSFLLRQKLEPDFMDALSVSPALIQQDITAKTMAIDMPRIGLVETYFHDMDAGWTRFVFDSYNIPFEIIRPAEIAKSDLKFDIIIFPDADKNLLVHGKQKSGEQFYISNYPTEYTKGMGNDGLYKIAKFLTDGGIILSWGRSTSLFTGTLALKISEKEKQEFQLPIRDVSEKLIKQGLYCPGSLLKLNLKEDHPITWGMGKDTGIFYRGRPVFSTSVPNFDMDRRVIGRFPETDILLSGFCQNEKLVGDKSALVWLKKGKGQLVLFGFSPQFRASTQTTFKLLFNSLLLERKQ